MRPPEKSSLEKELEKLKRENIRLRKNEPDFQVKMVDSESVEVDLLEVNWQSYEPLSEESIAKFVDDLTVRFPMVTSFASNVNSFSGLGSLMRPPRQDEIRRYYEEYSNWTKLWRLIFANMHNILPMLNAPSFRVEATNSGICPGKDALVDIVAKGPLKVRPTQTQAEQEELRGEVFPLPPTAPQTKSMVDSLTATIPDFPYFPSAQSDDPNEFYFKPSRPQMPVERFSLECKQWRHGPHQKVFDGQLFLSGPCQKSEGALECVIQAENLSEPVKRTFPVRFTIEEYDTLQPIQSLIIELSGRECTKV